jgi:hypothetical protein
MPFDPRRVLISSKRSETDGVEIVVEQVGAGVERHGRRGVSEGSAMGPGTSAQRLPFASEGGAG